MPSELSTCPSLPPVAVATAVYRGWNAIIFLRLMFFVAIRNPVIASPLRRSLTSAAADFQCHSPTRVPGHGVVGKIDAFGFLATSFEVSLGCKPSLKVQRTADYQPKVRFPYTLDRPPEVFDSRRSRYRVPKLY